MPDTRSVAQNKKEIRKTPLVDTKIHHYQYRYIIACFHHFIHLIEVLLIPDFFLQSFSNLTNNLSALCRAFWSFSSENRSTRTFLTILSNVCWSISFNISASSICLDISSSYSAISQTSFLRIHCFNWEPLRCSDDTSLGCFFLLSFFPF